MLTREGYRPPPQCRAAIRYVAYSTLGNADNHHGAVAVTTLAPKVTASTHATYAEPPDILDPSAVPAAANKVVRPEAADAAEAAKAVQGGDYPLPRRAHLPCPHQRRV